MRIGLIAYNFPHRKTQDFIFRLLAEGYSIEVILAADKKQLNIPKSSIRRSVRFNALIEPSHVAYSFGIPFERVDHNSESMCALIRKYNLDLGIISGARILKEDVINSFTVGVINFHPGLIPEARGLDALLWSVYKNIPVGVTSHLINKQIDAGSIISRQEIIINEGDTLIDLYEKVYCLQLNLISESIEKVRDQNFSFLGDIGQYYGKMSPELESEVLLKVEDYVRANKAN